MYGTDVPFSRSSPTPISATIVLTNPFGFPIPVTFAMGVTDSAGLVSVQIVTVVVLPTFDPVLDVAAVQSPSNPMVMNLTPSVTGVAGRHPWVLATTGTGFSDVFLSFPDTVLLESQRILVQRGPGVAVTANVKFQYGDADRKSVV